MKKAWGIWEAGSKHPDCMAKLVLKEMKAITGASQIVSYRVQCRKQKPPQIIKAVRNLMQTIKYFQNFQKRQREDSRLGLQECLQNYRELTYRGATTMRPHKGCAEVKIFTSNAVLLPLDTQEIKKNGYPYLCIASTFRDPAQDVAASAKLPLNSQESETVISKAVLAGRLPRIGWMLTSDWFLPFKSCPLAQLAYRALGLRESEQ